MLLKKISKFENIDVIRDVINSVNDNQIKNKLWLIDKLKPYLNIYTDPKIMIAAGWHGLLAHLLDDRDNITSFDIDDKCAQTVLFDNVNYKTNDIEKQDPKDADILICTSCEHITDDQILTWIKRKKQDSLIVLQSNDYFQIEDHINCKLSLSQFSSSITKKAKKKKIDLRVINSYELEMPRYTRFMLFLT
jgi:hypothetical protein|tara:strand:- start:24 stop:596 length:573 start_codon:yes stop_codon:yes gene_type:complete